MNSFYYLDKFPVMFLWCVIDEVFPLFWKVYHSEALLKGFKFEVLEMSFRKGKIFQSVSNNEI